jgi:transcriptional regulator MraZ
MDRQVAFRGNHPAKIDDRGRLKIPSEYRSQLEALFGPTPSVFITSDDDEGRFALIYPLSHWEAYEAKLAQMPSSSEAREKLLDNVSYFGSNTQLDAQGRLLIPATLRESAALLPESEVFVLGHVERLTVWNQARWHEHRAKRRTTTEDRKEREKFGL